MKKNDDHAPYLISDYLCDRYLFVYQYRFGGVVLKITMSRRDDILKRKQAYEDAYNQQGQEYNEYRKDTSSILDKLSDLVRSKIGDTSLNLKVRAEDGFKGLSVSINNGDNPHDDQALNWNWEVNLTKDGEVEKDSGSWSGLSAITSSQLENLKESVRVLEILNNIDWVNVLNVELPKYEDYVKTEVPKKENFDQQLLEEDIKDAIAEGKLIKGHGYKYYNQRATVFYHVLKETPKQYDVQEIYEDDVADEAKWPGSYRVPKETFMQLISKPLQTVEV